MALGMTYDQYWYGDPLMVRAFYKADKLRQERMDEEAWLHGVYMVNALNATVGNAFRKQGQSPIEYPKEPISLTRRKEEEKARTEKAKEQEAVWALAWMTSFVRAGRNWGKNKKKQEGDVPWQTEQLIN